MIDFLRCIHLICIILTLLIQSSKGQKAWKHLFMKRHPGGNNMILKKLDIFFFYNFIKLLLLQLIMIKCIFICVTSINFAYIHIVISGIAK
jgi:hypothetical protein